MYKALLAGLAALSLSTAAHAIDLADLSNKDAGAGLKEALGRAASAAVGQLGRADGYLGDERVKIPLPGNLQKAEKLLRNFGMGDRADELVTAMNRSAERAVQEARPILADAVRKMSWQDAKGILAGGETAATEYFQRTTRDSIAAKFLPIVQNATAKVKLAETYNRYAGQAAQFGLIKAGDANLDQYVTQKALDGLYLMIADQERAIRQDPIGQGSKLLQKVFSAR